MNDEDLLRQTLRSKAAGASTDLTLDDIREGAGQFLRQTRRRRTTLLAAAAVVAIAGPTSVVLSANRDAPTPTPPVSSSTPSNTPSQTPSPSPPPSPPATAPATAVGLDSIPRGADPRVTYLSQGVVHQPDGTTSRFPGGAQDVTQFTAYHGGWLVIDSTGNLTQYDDAGNVVRRSRQGDSSIAVSADQVRTAFLLDGHVLTGISSGMSDGETDHPIGAGSELVGFLGDRVVYNSPAGAVRAVDDLGTETSVPGLSQATSTSADGDLVAGRAADNEGARVVSASDGRTLWTKPGWVTGRFSPDGRYLAAYRSATGGEFETVAMLDARTGKVVAISETPGIQALPASQPGVWEDEDTLLIPYRGASTWTVLRLSPNGTVVRATDVVTATAAETPFVFATRP